jgi:hypothetical protein
VKIILIVLETRLSKVKAPADSVSAQGLLLEHTVIVFISVGRDKRSLLGLPNKGINPIREDSTPMT